MQVESFMQSEDAMSSPMSQLQYENAVKMTLELVICPDHGLFLTVAFTAGSLRLLLMALPSKGCRYMSTLTASAGPSSRCMLTMPANGAPKKSKLRITAAACLAVSATGRV